jgi:hypothetical protein
MKLKNLTEGFETTVHLQGHPMEVFTFPATNKEIDDIVEVLNGVRYIRFIASPKLKKIYIFSPEVMHYDIWRHLPQKEMLDQKNSFWGVASRTQHETWKVDRRDTAPPSADLQKLDWSWADEYINMSDYMKDPEAIYGHQYFDRKRKSIYH